MNLYATPEFKEWLSSLREWDRAQIRDRLDRIGQHSHFGDRKYLGDDLFELRWRNGRRAYFSMMTDREGQAVLMLLGGGKNGQNRDISAARKILEREAA